MSTNDPQRKIPTPADLDPDRAASQARLRQFVDSVSEEIDAREKAAKEQGDNTGSAETHREDQPTAPTPADVAPAITEGGIVRVPVVELSKDQRVRVEALHAARRVLGTPQAKGGQLATSWAWQAIELADYILTGEVDRGTVPDDEAPAGRSEDAQGRPGEWIDLDKPLPAGLPPAVAATLQQLQQAYRTGGVLPRDGDRIQRAREERVQRDRDHVDRMRKQPDGLKELNAQGYFPVDGSEPPRSEPIHDVHCVRWNYDQQTGQWHRWVRGIGNPDGPTELVSGTWGSALAEFGPFHVCA